MNKNNFDNFCLKAHGTKIVDTVTNLKTGEKKVLKRTDNIIVKSILPLFMSFLKNGTLKGIQYWAVGSGVESWDSNPVEPLNTETKLTNEIGRKEISSSDITFLNESGEESVTPTNTICIKLTFDTDDCNGTWREFGIFGGNATSTKDSGYLIDKKHHEVLTKTNEMLVDRKIIIDISI